MRYLSIFRGVETETPPSPEEMAAMGALIEKFAKSGHLIALARQFLEVAGDGECEVRELCEAAAFTS